MAIINTFELPAFTATIVQGKGMIPIAKQWIGEISGSSTLIVGALWAVVGEYSQAYRQNYKEDPKKLYELFSEKPEPGKTAIIESLVDYIDRSANEQNITSPSYNGDLLAVFFIIHDEGLLTVGTYSSSNKSPTAASALVSGELIHQYQSVDPHISITDNMGDRLHVDIFTEKTYQITDATRVAIFLSTVLGNDAIDLESITASLHPSNPLQTSEAEVLAKSAARDVLMLDITFE